MEDPNILDIDSQVLMEIETILENKSSRDSFLRSVPPNIFDSTSIQLMDNESYKYHMTTAKWLLVHLGNKGVRVSEFVQWLEEAKLERALLLLKRDVPIRIIEQPPSIVQVQRGTKFSIICNAASFPFPIYQWFKVDEGSLKELLLQQDKELMFDSIMEEDSGIFVCLVVKPNLEPNSPPWSYIYSNPVEVVVLKESSQNPHIQKDLISDSLFTGESLKSISDNLESLPLSKLEGKTAKIKSKVHPPGAKVAQGLSITLHCKAKYINSKSKLPTIQYQWYKNGRPIDGATSCNLPLNYLYSDPDTGDRKWQYSCKAFNDYDHEFSNTVVVELENETDLTTHFASEKYAFMIANDTYDNLQQLKKPTSDVSVLGKLLEKMNFKVFAYRNLNLTQMKNAFKKFYTNLEPSCYVLFYFAGHGFEQLGQLYLQPVDCSEQYDPLKAICTDEILECLQTKKPKVNVLLIDACRNLPPLLSNKSILSAQEMENFRILKAKMENNTVYGYSTPVHYSAHECDSEPNSFFVKYLKNCITHDKSILEILRQVQLDFKGDPLVKNIQFPEIRSTLSGNQKFCDEILNHSNHPPSSAFTLNDLREDLTPFEFPLFESTLTIKTSPYLDIFINGISIVVSIFISRNTPIEVLNQLEIDLISNTQDIELLPTTSVCLKDLDKKISDNNILLEKQAFGIEKLQGYTLDCKLLIKFPQLQKHREGSVKIDVKSITNLKLSTNYLGSLVIERNS